MLTVAFDTNIILNAAMGRPGAEDAGHLVQAVLDGRINGIVSSNSITDIHYVVRKHAGEEQARSAVYNVLCVFDTVSVDGDACMTALNLPMADYEDAVLAACAVREDADCIVTGDAAFLAETECPVRVMDAKSVLTLLEQEAEAE